MSKNSNSYVMKRTLMGLATCCLFSLMSQVQAMDVPAEVRTEMQYQAGTSYMNDTVNMRYSRSRKAVERDYQYYERRKQLEEDPDNTSEIIRDLNGTHSGGYGIGKDGQPVQGNVSATEISGIYVTSVEVAPSEILSSSEINEIAGRLVGKEVYMEDLQSVIDDLNKLYENKGYITARAFLPEQTVSEGKIYIGLMESRVGQITVENNRHTTDNFILNRMPQKAGEIFDVVELEKDVLDFNRYHEGVNLTANLKAGTKPGTTDIELEAHETFPWHIAGVMDNAGRYTTGRLRGGVMLYNDSLFHQRDRMSVGTYLSGHAQSPFFDYNIPVNKGDGRIGFMYSSTFAKIGYGALKDLDLKSKSYMYSLYFQQPIVRKPGLELKGLAALNYKRSRTTLFDNLIELDRDQVTSADIGFQLRKDTKYGIWYLNQDFYYAFPIFDKESDYFKYSGSIVRLHDFSHGVIGQIRSNYQIIPGNKHIPYLDQFQTGGLATVRGYNEGIMIGKNGYFLSGELMFPLLPREITGRDGEKRAFVGKYIKGAIFTDHAGIFPAAKEDIYDGSYFVSSVGLGLRVQLPADLSARLYWGFPLINNRWETDRKYGRFHFELTLSPNFDALLASRYRNDVKAQPAPAQQYIDNYPDPRHYDYFKDGGGGSL